MIKYIYMCVCVNYIIQLKNDIYIYVCVYMYIYIYIYIYVCVCIYIYVYIYIYYSRKDIAWWTSATASGISAFLLLNLFEWFQQHQWWIYMIRNLFTQFLIRYRHHLASLRVCCFKRVCYCYRHVWTLMMKLLCWITLDAQTFICLVECHNLGRWNP